MIVFHDSLNQLGIWLTEISDVKTYSFDLFELVIIRIFNDIFKKLFNQLKRLISLQFLAFLLFMEQLKQTHELLFPSFDFSLFLRNNLCQHRSLDWFIENISQPTTISTQFTYCLITLT